MPAFRVRQDQRRCVDMDSISGSALKLTRLSALAILVPLLGPIICAQEQPKWQPTIWSAKPEVAAFETMENDRLATAQRAIDRLIAVEGTRTIENTLVPFDEATERLDAANYLATVVEEVHPDATFRDHATAMLGKASAAQTALSLNRGVYNALASLDLSRVDTATRYYVQRQLLEFRLAGVDKDDATRRRLRKLNGQLTSDQSLFERNITDDEKRIEVADISELDGLPQDFIESHKPGADGKIQITTNESEFFTVMKYAKSDALRRRLWVAYTARAYPKNRDVLVSMMRTRYEIATLLGYPSWADYNAANEMILNGKNIAHFVREIDAAARPVMEREYQILLGEKQKTHPEAKKLWDYDGRYFFGGFYVEEVRRSKYNFDSQTVRPYFPFNQVKKGVLDTAAKLFNVTFRQEIDAPSWDPSVETWDVFDGGRMIGRFYLDTHPRRGKSTGGTQQVLDGVRGKQLPEAVLITNDFPAPTATDPGLMDYRDVVNFFHEFGHIMHHILGGQQQWAGISGFFNAELDFIEVPPELLEEWVRSPQVLTSFARHYKTGEPIPTELVERMNRAYAFGRGMVVADENAKAAISYDIYARRPKEIDLSSVCLDDTRRFTLFSSTPGSCNFYTNFTHLADYSSAFYTYLWDRVIAVDLFQKFNRENLFAGDAPARYRHFVLEPGASMSGNDIVKNFLGRPHNMAAFKRWLAEEFETSVIGPKVPTH